MKAFSAGGLVKKKKKKKITGKNLILKLSEAVVKHRANNRLIKKLKGNVWGITYP